MFIKIFLSCFLPCPKEGYIEMGELSQEDVERIYQNFDYSKIEESTDCVSLFKNTLLQIEGGIMEKERFIQLLKVLVLTQKGLTLDEIKAITKISDHEWKLVLACLSEFFICYQNLWILNNMSLKKVITQLYLKDESEVNELHMKISQNLDKNNSIRKLEEQCFHLFKCRNYNKLKEIISAIENFLLLFNPNNKFDLCRYWQTLEIQGQFDPVIEYNKAIEGFEMKYHPTTEDVFRIIVQISRFLKEFSDFETYFTPAFRHPPITGNKEELDDIGLLRELYTQNIFFSKDMVESEMEQKMRANTGGRSVTDRIQQLMDKKNCKKNPAKIQDDENPVDQKLNWNNQNKKNKKVQILNEIESLNVDIPSNREIFRNFYLQELEQILNEENNNKMKTEETKFDENDSQIEDDDDMSQKNLDNENLQKMLEQVENRQKEDDFINIQQIREHYKLQDRIPTNYYYKRWIWIQFPWSCLSLKCDYSNKLQKCFSSATEYMSVSDENKFTKQALKIAFDSKKKLEQMYAKKPEPQKQAQDPSLLIKSDISRISHVPSLPRLQNKASLGQKSQSISKLNLNLDDTVDDYGMQKVSKYNKTTTIQSQKQPQQSETSVAFFITEDEYLQMNNLNKEVENQKGSPLAQKNKKVQNSLSHVEQPSQNTSKILEKSRLFKDKSKYFDPVNSIQESSKYSSVLPRLKNSINNHSQREYYLLEQQSYDLKKELDHLVSENKRMAKKLKELKIIEHSNSRGVDSNQVDVAKTKVQNTKNLIQETQNNYYYSILQTERFTKILKICDENKKQNEEWIRALNYLLNNLKKMIKSEQDSIKTCKEESAQLRKINKSYLEAFNTKMNNHYKLISQIKRNLDNKKKIDTMFVQSDSLINTSAVQQVEKMKNDQKGQDAKRKQKDKQTLLEKTGKQMQEQLEQMRKQFDMVKEIIDIQDDGYAQKKDFQDFLAAIEKRADLNGIILGRDDTLYGLETELEQKKSYLNVLKEAYNEEQPSFSKNQELADEEPQEDEGSEEYAQKIREIQEQVESKSHILKRLELTRLRCIMTLQTIQKKLGVEQGATMEEVMNLDHQLIIEKLDVKLELIKKELEESENDLKNLQEEKMTYEDFIQSNYDKNIIFKQLVKRNQEYYENYNDNSLQDSSGMV